MSNPAHTALNPLPHLMRTVWLQVLRRKDLYLLAFVMLAFMTGAVIVRFMGVDRQELARFVSSLGLTLSSVLAGLLTILVSARQLPAEIESRTIYPVLAKPVSRLQLVLGKFLPTLAVATMLYLTCMIITLLVSPHLQFQSFVMLFQAAMFKLLALAMLSAMTFMLSLLTPMSVSVILGIGLYYFGAMAVSAAYHAFADNRLVSLALRLIPDFSMLDHAQRYVDGAAPFAAEEFIAVLLYGLGWTGFFFIGTLSFFTRRPL